MPLLIKNFEYKTLVFLPYVALFMPPRFIYLSSFISILISLFILLRNNLRIFLNINLILFIMGFFLCFIYTFKNLYNPEYINLSTKSLVLQSCFIFQFLIAILLVNNNKRIELIYKIYNVIKENIILLSIISFFGNVICILQAYQGSTSWPSLITFNYALLDKTLNYKKRIFIIILNIITIVISSKRSAILALFISILLYLVYKSPVFIKQIKSIIFNNKIKNKSIYLIFSLISLFILLVSFEDYIFNTLTKLKSTIDIIANNTEFDYEYKLLILTGGRNIELVGFLDSLNISLSQFIQKVFTTGIGIGWFNKTTLSGSFHNSFLLISLLGGLPWLVLQLRILLTSFQGFFKTDEITANRIKIISIISISLFIDAFFSGNFAASFLALLLFASPLGLEKSLLSK